MNLTSPKTLITALKFTISPKWLAIIKQFAAKCHVCLAFWLLLTRLKILNLTLLRWAAYRLCRSLTFLNTHHFFKPLHNQSWGCRHWLTDSVYYSLSLTERISKGCHRSPVSEDLINRTCHIPLYPLPFSELIKAIPICCNYTKHVTIKLCRWLIWVVERIN